MSGIAVLLVVALVVLVWRNTERRDPARLGASLSAVAILGEAAIGAMIVLAEWVADDTSVARAVSVPLHLINTLFLLACLTLTIFWLGGGSRLDLRKNRAVTRAVLLGGLALILITGTGAVTALADTLFPKTVGGDITGEQHFLERLRVVHPVLAVFAASIGWWLASRSEMGRTNTARALPVLVGLMLVTGGLNVALGVPVWMQLVHLALADALWVAYVLVSAEVLQVSATTESRLSPSR
jgi:heme A synthase